MSAPIFKILIDFDEYLKLLSLKEVVKKQEEELKKHYETKTLASKVDHTSAEEKQITPKNNSKETIAEEQQKVDEENKVGAGSATNLDRSDLIKQITLEVTKTLEKYYDLKPSSSAVNQDGSGADDLITAQPIPIPNDNPIFPPVQNVDIHKSDLNDNFDIQKLLQSVPEENLEKAEILLKKLQEFPNEITWDSSGTIFIDQKSLPESNIYDLFPKLFRKVANANKILNLREVASKIASLGFGYLINGRYTGGLSRKKPVPNEAELIEKMKSYPNWWYIGN